MTDTPDPLTVGADQALADLAVEALSTVDGRPFCKVTATLADGRQAFGQLTPGEVIGLGTQWIECAQAARDDAAIVKAVTDLLVDLGSDRTDAVMTAASLLDAVRKDRQDNVLAGEGIEG